MSIIGFVNLYKKLVGTLPFIFAIGLVVVGWHHRFWLFDSYRLAFFEPTAEVSSLSQRAGMSDQGERLFLAAQPQLLLEDQFDQECQFAELGLVLGCYKSADIFILDVTEQDLEPVESVTAAHEMLHVVYSRLTGEEKTALNNLLDAQLLEVTNQRIIEEIDGYRSDPDADLHNEMHSIFGTELAQVTSELSTHYDKYFNDRGAVLSESQKYEAIFQELETEIEGYDGQLESLGSRIDVLEQITTVSGNQIDAQRAQLNIHERNNDAASYNALAATFNQLVITHNSNVGELQDLIKQFNDIVALRNQNSAARNNLIKSLDSDIKTVE